MVVAARSEGMNALSATNFYTLKRALFQPARFDAALPPGV
jgi:hypothetical protein